MTLSDFKDTVNDNSGEVLVTSGGRARFLLEKSDEGVKFTPLSTGKSREINAESIQRYLDVYNKTKSTITSDYTDRMRNASYVVAVFKLWLGQQPNAPLIDYDTNELERVAPEFVATEGEIKFYSHHRRERSRHLVLMAKDVFRSHNGGRLFCEVCGFDFGRTYGEPDYIEAHHRVPICDLKPGAKTKLSDLSMVCANCHRMLHLGNPWPTIEELKRKIEVPNHK